MQVHAFLCLALLVAAPPGPRDVGEKCSVSGVVLDRDGKPVRGAKVSISCSEHRFDRRVTTGREGKFSLENLKPGHYAFRLEKGRSWNSRLKMADVMPGTNFKVEFVPLGNATALCGAVVDSEGVPVVECRVSANNIHHRGRGDEPVSVSTTADHEGFFAIDNLPPGRFDLKVSKGAELCSSPGGTVLLETGMETEVTINIHPGTVHGVVKVDSKRNAASTRVQLYATRKGDFGGPQWIVYSLTIGEKFAIQNLPPGSFEIKALARDYYSDPVEFVVKKGKKPSKDLKIELLPAGAVLLHLIDRDGDPVEGVSVTEIVPQGASSVQVETLGPGEFLLHSLPPGKREYSITASGIGQVRRRVEVKGGKQVELEVQLQ